MAMPDYSHSYPGILGDVDLPVEERMSREFTQLKVCFASMLKKIKKSLSEIIKFNVLR